MANLTAALGAATRSLSTFSEAISVVQNNIANAATPGYARQRISLAPIVTPDGQALGVESVGVQALRDRLLDFQVFLGLQNASLFDKKADIFAQVEPFFKLTGERSISGSVDNFFAALSALSISPGDFNLRRAVLQSGGGLVDAVRTTFSAISQTTVNLEQEAQTTVRRINGLLDQVGELATLGINNEENENFAAQTRLNQVLDELAGLINFTLIRQGDGALSIVTGGGEALVVGATVRPLTVAVAADGISVLDVDGRDITAGIESRGGSLGAILELRNQRLFGYLDQINRLTKAVVDQVNEQHARGVDITGAAGTAIFEYQTSFVTGAGRTAGTAGNVTPAPPVSIDVTFSGGVVGAITATLDSFFVAASASSVASAGDRASVTFTSADGTISRTITTSPLLGGETTAQLATRLNDVIAVDPELAGLITFSDAAGNLKVALSEAAGQGFSLTATTSNPAFTTGLESGAALGGHSAREIAAALNAEVAANQALSDDGIRFVAVAGEVRLDGDVAFDFTVVDNDPAATGFVSGLAGSGQAGGAVIGNTIRLANLGPANVAAGIAGSPGGNENALLLSGIADLAVVNGATYGEAYSGLVNEVGQDSADASSQLETQQQILSTARNLRESLSGVDINEEAVRLLQFQQAFQAQTRVIQVVDNLLNEILGLVR